MSLTISFKGGKIAVTYPSVSKEHAEKAIDSAIFKRWKERCEKGVENKSINIKSVEIQSVDMFGPRVGFVKLKADVRLIVNGKEIPKFIPGISFLRGDSVGILLALCCEDGKKYTLLVEQPRVPTGDAGCLEMPAGMIDDGTVKGAAVKEIEEECGIKIVSSDLVDLSEGGHKMLPSPGGCDEAIGLYYCEKKVTVKELNDMQGRIHGKSDEGEHIQLHVIPFEEGWKRTGDAKLLSAMFLYEKKLGALSGNEKSKAG